MVDYVPDEQKEMVQADGTKKHLAPQPGQSSPVPVTGLTFMDAVDGRVSRIKVDPKGLKHATSYLAQAAGKLRQASDLIRGVDVNAGEFAEAVAFEGALTQVCGPLASNVFQLSGVCDDAGEACVAYAETSGRDEGKRKAAIADWDSALADMDEGLAGQKELKILSPQPAPKRTVTKPEPGTATGGQPKPDPGEDSDESEDSDEEGHDWGMS